MAVAAPALLVFSILWLAVSYARLQHGLKVICMLACFFATLLSAICSSKRPGKQLMCRRSARLAILLLAALRAVSTGRSSRPAKSDRQLWLRHRRAKLDKPAGFAF